MTKGLALEISGYPGDPDKDGYLYTHQGPVHSLYQTPKGGWIVKYKVDTTPGNSGSMINVIDEKWVLKKKAAKGLLLRTDARKVTVGVHSGYDAKEKVNYGSVITKDID